jgi:hypothetical protein
MDKLTTGDYGRFDFVIKKKGLITPFNLCATVIDIDRKCVLLRDNDDIEYLIPKSDIKSFEREPQPCETCKN